MQWWRTPALGILGLALSGCGGDLGSDPGATTGAIEVITEVVGAPFDPDGYVLTLDQGPRQPLGVSDTVQLTAVSPGPHQLSVEGIASDCRVSGTNPRTVTAAANQTAHTRFALVCGPRGTGRLMVFTFTYGRRAPSYQVVVTNGPSASIGPGDQIIIAGVRAGLDTVALTQVPVDCHVYAPNPRFVTVPNGGERGTIFKIRCPE